MMLPRGLTVWNRIRCQRCGGGAMRFRDRDGCRWWACSRCALAWTRWR